MDTQWPGNIFKVVPHLENLGYHRYWTTEHRSPYQSSSPVLLAALAAQSSKTLRIGTAGVLLNMRSPTRVVEQFKLLEMLYPQRIDLGIAGALAKEPYLSPLLDGRPYPTKESYYKKVREVVRLIRNRPSLEHGIDARIVGPSVSTRPQIWLCGTSIESAKQAGRLGIAFAYHHHLCKDRHDGSSIIRAYIDTFKPKGALPEPTFTVACYGLCAETEKEAHALWPADAKQASFLGSSVQCKEQLLEVQNHYQTDELVVQSMCEDLQHRLYSYELLASRLLARRGMTPQTSCTSPG